MQTISKVKNSKNLNIFLILFLTGVIVTSCATEKGFSINTNNDATAGTAQVTPLYKSSEELEVEIVLQRDKTATKSKSAEKHQHIEKATEDDEQSDDGENE